MQIRWLSFQSREPIEEPVDILFLGNSYYAFSIDPEVREFIRQLDKSKVGRIVNFGSAAMLNSTAGVNSKDFIKEDQMRTIWLM